MTAEIEDVRLDARSTSPYRGLMPYTEADAEYFFGRESEIVLIANTVRAHRFGVLYGPSGVGKSSVLRAGVVRHIRDENRQRQERYGELETVVAYLKEWRDDPNAALAAAIVSAFHDTDGTVADIPADDLVRATVRLCENRELDLVLILDQFEEFTLYHRTRVADFAEVIARLTAPTTTVNVLVAIREDALSRLDEFEGIVPEVFANTLRLDHLDEHSARSAITEPLGRYNAEVEEGGRREIEPALVDALLREVQTGRVRVDQLAEPTRGPSDHEGGDDVRIEAPYLQLVLTRLWDEENQRGSHVLRLATLRELGGAQEIVRQHLDRVMAGFVGPDLETLADAFGHLVTPSGSKIAHRPSDLAELSGRDPAQMAALLRRLAEGDQRILREVPPPLDEPDAEPRYEIFHDVLALAVLDWRRRVLTDVAARTQREQLAATTRRLRRARAVVLGMALLLVACIALAGWAVHSRDQAQDAEKDARLNRVLSEVTGTLSTDPARALELAQRLVFEVDDQRYEDAYRIALDAADTDVIVDVGSSVRAASMVGTESLMAITDTGRLMVWDVVDAEGPLRIADEPRLDLQVTENAQLVDTARVVADDHYLVVQASSGVSAVNLRTGEVRGPPEPDDRLPFVDVAEGGPHDRLLLWGPSGRLAVWDVTTNRTTPVPVQVVEPTWAAIDPSGRYVAALGGTGPDVAIVDLSSGREIARTVVTSRLSTPQVIGYGVVRFVTSRTPDGAADPVLVIAAFGLQVEGLRWDFLHERSPSGLGSDTRWLQIFDAASLATAGTEEVPSSARLAVAGDKVVTVFDADGPVQAVTAPSNDWVIQVEADPQDPSVFALGSGEGDVELYRTNLSPARPMWTFRGHRGPVNDLTFSGDGRHLVSAGADGTVRVWRLPPQMDYSWYREDWILGARVTPDGRYLFGYSNLGRSVVRDRIGTDSDHREVSLPLPLAGMDPAPDGSRVVVGNADCGLPRVLPMEPGQPTINMQTNLGFFCPTVVVWNPVSDLHQVLAGSQQGHVVAWDPDTGDVTRSISVGYGEAEVSGLAVSGDGRIIAAGTTGGVEGGGLYLLSAEDLSTVATWEVDALRSVDLSTDGRYVAVAGRDEPVVTVYDTHDLDEPALRLTQASGSLRQVTISPDPEATRIAVASTTGTVYVWDRASGRLLAAMTRHADAVNEVAFDPNDLDHLYSAGDDGFMVSYTCELCALDAEKLRDAAADRLAQEVDAGG